MFSLNLRLFRLMAIPVEINVSWLLVLALMTWTFATGLYPDVLLDGSRMELWGLGFATAILVFVSILLHEFSHSLVAARNGLPIRKITLFLFGGVAQMERDVDNPTVELKMAAAGPAMSVVLAALFFALSRIFSQHRLVYLLMNNLAYVNLLVLGFNMVPGFPLDGGRILRAAIWRATGNVQKATRIASRIGGIPEIVKDGANGLLVPPGDAGALAGAISALCADHKLAARLGRAAARDAERDFGEDRYAREIEAVYREA